MSEALRKAAQAALTALEQLDGVDTETESVTIYVSDEIEALRAALAEPEQSEPVDESPADYSYALIDRFLRNNLDDEDYEKFSTALDDIYTAAPPRREPLTTAQIDALIPESDVWKYEIGFDDVIEFARAVEAAHGIGGKE